MKTCNDCIHKSICYWGKSKLSACADKCEDFKAEKTGHWINHKDEHQCSRCRETIIVDMDVWEDCSYDYCPNCGAKMESEEQT